MSAVNLITQVRSGIVQFRFEREGNLVGTGSGFLVDGGILTNSHVIRGGKYDSVALFFADSIPDDPDSYIRLSPDTINASVNLESPENEFDYAYLELNEPEFENRYRFYFGDSDTVSIGEQVLFLGFPFGMHQMTAHMGYVSSKHLLHHIPILQIDGSVNGGNSGGPLINIDTGQVIGIVTRAVTGLIEQQFNNLIMTLEHNIEALRIQGARMTIGGIDPIVAIRASQAAMRDIAINLKRTANVGIGYAYSSNRIRDELASRVDD